MTNVNRETHVAVLGLGLIGQGMASSLLNAGFSVTVYNRSREKCEPFAGRGARIAATPRDAASEADVLICIVADDNASRHVWTGDEGALLGAKPGSILIDAGTLSVAWILELAAAADEQDCALLDAPVTGSREQAAAGELTFLVGGAGDILERARPVFEATGKRILHMGPQGSGAMMKIVNNFLCGVQAASLSEAIGLIERSGLDREKAREMLETGAPASPLVKILYERMTDRDYTPQFHLKLMAKDLSYAIGEGERLDLALRTAPAARSIFDDARDGARGDDDFSAIVEQFRAG